MLRMTMCIVQNTHVSYQSTGLSLRIVCNHGIECPHTVVTVCLSAVPPSHSFVPPIMPQLFHRYSSSSQSVKNPLRTLPHSWLNPTRFVLTPRPKIKFVAKYYSTFGVNMRAQFGSKSVRPLVDKFTNFMVGMSPSVIERLIPHSKS